ncbi:tripartite tricarboxylate transporter substrate binding protein [Bordetella sp. LUAb4]|uniref:Bug family tripartite tricarboxylate transporter substrate binding protein n=1 Tax=Bordetella sp. LUAb4 TaxID=2843195 RepID=UPI001E5967EA|nr:tripartite tricarboxylate transporter substrate binding protein [Bordetella sp. LUAb4]
MQFKRRCLALAATLLIVPLAHAEAYPSKPVRLIAPAPAGGGTDFLARQYAMRWSQHTGQTVVVENVSGANGNIGASQVARATADGYTLLASYVGTQAINPSLYKAMPYNPEQDLIAIGNLATYPFVIAVNSSVPVHSLTELVDYARAHPDKMSFGSAGVGSGGHLVGELFNTRHHTKLTHVPYKGSAPMIQDLVGGQIQVIFDTLSTAGPFIKSGKIRALALTADERAPGYPDIPTVKELGEPDMVIQGWYGLFAPKGTPAPVLDALSASLKMVLASKDYQQIVVSAGYTPATYGDRDAYGKFVHAETQRWGELVKTSGATAN